MDETYIKVKGVWDYLYRAVDKKMTRLFLCYQNIAMKQRIVAVKVFTGYTLRSRHPESALCSKDLYANTFLGGPSSKERSQDDETAVYTKVREPLRVES